MLQNVMFYLPVILQNLSTGAIKHFERLQKNLFDMPAKMPRIFTHFGHCSNKSRNERRRLREAACRAGKGEGKEEHQRVEGRG